MVYTSLFTDTARTRASAMRRRVEEKGGFTRVWSPFL